MCLPIQKISAQKTIFQDGSDKEGKTYEKSI
ncbi:Uncharacterised protein [Streptococcus pneumoniae]|nr:Uncharacterised protein [Streptococcus pneumoniae]VLC25898.1 Uncharacterised protein [Streptococcus pneumoniae]VQG18271.1 Uncharacterised protein [Streptococcus pneumoniae]VQJ91879.1 Uncharacterised protein [Streptococcus pneumoniae]VQL96140.1 Uncharacterised protein [Streptococcus pneumoniae]